MNSIGPNDKTPPLTPVNPIDEQQNSLQVQDPANNNSSTEQVIAHNNSYISTNVQQRTSGMQERDVNSAFTHTSSVRTSTSDLNPKPESNEFRNYVYHITQDINGCPKIEFGDLLREDPCSFISDFQLATSEFRQKLIEAMQDLGDDPKSFQNACQYLDVLDVFMNEKNIDIDIIENTCNKLFAILQEEDRDLLTELLTRVINTTLRKKTAQPSFEIKAKTELTAEKLQELEDKLTELESSFTEFINNSTLDKTMLSELSDSFEKYVAEIKNGSNTLEMLRASSQLILLLMNKQELQMIQDRMPEDGDKEKEAMENLTTHLMSLSITTETMLGKLLPRQPIQQGTTDASLISFEHRINVFLQDNCGTINIDSLPGLRDRVEQIKAEISAVDVQGKEEIVSNFLENELPAIIIEFLYVDHNRNTQQYYPQITTTQTIDDLNDLESIIIFFRRELTQALLSSVGTDDIDVIKFRPKVKEMEFYINEAGSQNAKNKAIEILNNLPNILEEHFANLEL